MFGKSRALATSYLWFVLVPVAAKVIHALPSSMTLGGAVFRLDFGLPFTWTVFYFSAVFFALAGLVFGAFCPRVVKDHHHAQDFLAAGKSTDHLKEYIEDLPPLRLDSRRRTTMMIEPTDPHSVAEAFWAAYRTAVVARPVARGVCLGLYVAGFVLLAFVAVENLVFVISALS